MSICHEDEDARVIAARACRACAVLTSCRAYGERWPDELGVYGADPSNPTPTGQDHTKENRMTETDTVRVKAARPPLFDEHGIEHRHGCTLPGWISNRPACRGWHVVTCAGCGCVRLIRAGVR